MSKRRKRGPSQRRKKTSWKDIALRDGELMDYGIKPDQKPAMEIGFSMLKQVAREKGYKHGFEYAMCKNIFGRSPDYKTGKKLPPAKPNKWLWDRVAEHIKLYARRQSDLKLQQQAEAALADEAKLAYKLGKMM